VVVGGVVVGGGVGGRGRGRQAPQALSNWHITYKSANGQCKKGWGKEKLLLR
jgi:hypothetical protein